MELFQKKTDIFTRLAKSAEVMRDASKVFSTLVEPGAARTAGTQMLVELKKQGDAIKHDLINRLNRSFTSPIDREDFHALAVDIDSVTDAITAAAMMLDIYHMDKVEPGTRTLTEALSSALDSLNAAIADLRHFKARNQIRERCQEVAAWEKRGDQAFIEVMRHLFAEISDPIEIIKQKDIAEAIERALDLAADAADTLQNILVKNS